MLPLLWACAKGPSESATDTNPPTPTETAESESESESEVCPFSGRWDLRSLACDGKDVTKALGYLVDEVYVLVETPTSGGCRFEQWVKAATCLEVEETYGSLETADSWAMSGLGITQCDPLACTFTGGDLPCEVGDRDGSWTETIVLDGRISTSRGGGLCGLFGGTVSDAVWDYTAY